MGVLCVLVEWCCNTAAALWILGGAESPITQLPQLYEYMHLNILAKICLC